MMEVSISLLLLTSVFAMLTVKLVSALRGYRKKWTTFRKLPGPTQTPYPPFGHAMMFGGDSCDFYETILRVIKNDIHARGKEIGCLWFGIEPVVIVAGAKAAEVLFHSSKHTEKSFMYDFFRQWLGTGLLLSKGEKWKARRRLLTPSFHFSILKEFLNSMNDQSTIFTKKLDLHAETGDQFDIFKLITLCALDIICETAMGEPVHAQDCADSEYVKAVGRVTELTLERARSPSLWTDIIFNNTSIGKEFRDVVKVLQDYTKSVIKERMNKFEENGKTGKKRRLAFLDQLIHASKSGEALSIEDIREEVDTFMFEGHDTTSAGMAWALHLIGSYPDVQKKIHDELDEVFCKDINRPVTTDDLRKLEYLEKVLKESLRLLPSVVLIGRLTTSDCRIDGYDIPARTACTIALQAINKHHGYWTNPEKFDPERFSTERSEGRHAFAYVPFSAGPRNCIGQKFAIMEEKVVLSHVLRRFEVRSCDRTEDIRKMADAIMRPEQGINVILKRRYSVQK